jgi:AcrR family transcriptional regulator
VPNEIDVKERIVKAAAELFAEHGFGGTSVRSICQRAGVTQSSMYHHHDSKASLLQAVHNSVAYPLISRLELVAASDGTAAERIRGVFYTVLSHVDAYRSIMTVYLREHHALSEEARDEFNRNRDHVDTIVDSIIQRGIDQGEFREDLDVYLTRLAIMGMTSWSYQWYPSAPSSRIGEIGERFADLILPGLLSKGPKAET